MRKVRVRSVLVAVAVLLGLAAVGVALFAAMGVYNVASTKPHLSLVYRFLDYAMYESVKQHAEVARVPPLADPQRVGRGASHYRAHCVQCHGAPGVPPQPFALGMQPAPVNLLSAARHWQPREIFWVVKHGLKMTGMPAWEYQLGDEQIWDVVAFVVAMPTLAPTDYRRLADGLPPHPPHGAGAAPARPVLQPPVLGSVEAGRRAVAGHLCATCHHIPGIVGANSHVGPSLAGVGTRKFIAGVLANTPENMVRWLMNPQAIAPRSAMPALGVDEQEARDMAAYLYTLDAVP
jgi:mono/diheme cytochrome c family protein